MPSSKLLKERIESIQDTMKITNAMYLISSSKLRKARKNYQNVSPYFNRMRDTISRVVPHLPEEPVHPFFHDRTNEKSNPRRAYLVLTADKGMAGAFNQNILRFLKEHADENDRFYVIGHPTWRRPFSTTGTRTTPSRSPLNATLPATIARMNSCSSMARLLRTVFRTTATC